MDSYNPNIGLNDMIRTLREYWKVVFISSFLSTGLAYLYCVTTPPIYEASAVVVGADFLTRQPSENVNSSLSSLAGIAGIRSSGSPAQVRLKTIMHSSLLTNRLISKGGADRLLGFRPTNPSVLSSLKPFLGLPTIHVGLKAQRFMFVAHQQTDVKVNAISGTDAIKLTFRSSDRWQAMKFLSLLLNQSEDLLKSLAAKENADTISGLQNAVSRTDNVEVRSALSRALSDQVLLDLEILGEHHYNIQVISPAYANPNPVWPLPKLIILAGAIMGGLIGIFLAFLFAFFSQSFSGLRQPDSADRIIAHG